MALAWEFDHGSWHGFDDRRRLVATAVHYDTPEPGWRAFLRGHRVDGGPWATAEEAQAAADDAHGRSPAGSQPRTQRGP